MIPARASSQPLAGGDGGRWSGRFAPLLGHPGWLAAGAVVLVAILFVVLTGMRPEYDAYGWLVWGRQALHWDLDTNGAPSWKPLTFLFTFPYALFGRAQPWLWMVTAVAAALGGSVFAGRIAYRLTGPTAGRGYARVAAAVFAGLGVIGIEGYWHLILISNSDPMVVTLCLAAIDAHLCGRPRLAFLMLVLASLGRPEAWVFAGLYGVWLARRQPRMWIPVIVAFVAIGALWFGVAGLTSHSWLRPGQLALNSPRAVQGNKVTGVIGRFLGLYELPMQIAVGGALVLAVVRRDRVSLFLAGAAFLWVAIEIVFALHGWSAVPRLLIEPAAVMIALAGAAVGRVLSSGPSTRTVVRWAGPIAVLALVIALIPVARTRARTLHTEIHLRRRAAKEIDRLHEVIKRDGGAAKILACGQPVTVVGFQSTLAWEVGLNVGDVGYKPGRSIDHGDPIVLFKPHELGWQVRPIHTLPEKRAACARLRADTATG